jgi:hypothetical protein
MTAMLKRLSGMLEKARKIETAIASSVEGAASRATGTPSERPPLEVVHAVVDAVAREVQPAGRGQNSFPFNHVRVTFLAPTARQRAQLQAIVEGPEPLLHRIEARLRAAGCPATGLAVNVVFAARSRPEWSQPDCDVLCTRIDAVQPTAPESQQSLKLSVSAGSADRSAYRFAGSLIAIGRGAEIHDSLGRLIRVNDVSFLDGAGEINQAVSRLHARIEYDARSGSYRLFDEGSAQGTTVIRQGRGHVVSGTRAIVLATGDEICLGRARMKVRIGDDAGDETS